MVVRTLCKLKNDWWGDREAKRHLWAGQEINYCSKVSHAQLLSMHTYIIPCVQHTPHGYNYALGIHPTDTGHKQIGG